MSKELTNTSTAPKVWCVRADGGKYTEHFLKGGYAGIGWDGLDDLSHIQTRDELYPLIKEANPDWKSPFEIGRASCRERV